MSTVLQTVDEETSLPGKRFSVEEYRRMVAGGVFAEDERYELLDGVITAKVAKNPRHHGSIGLLSELLRPSPDELGLAFRSAAAPQRRLRSAPLRSSADRRRTCSTM